MTIGDILLAVVASMAIMTFAWMVVPQILKWCKERKIANMPFLFGTADNLTWWYPRKKPTMFKRVIRKIRKILKARR